MASTGCQWWQLPKDFPPVSTAQRYFYQWRGSRLRLPDLCQFDVIRFA